MKRSFKGLLTGLLAFVMIISTAAVGGTQVFAEKVQTSIDQTVSGRTSDTYNGTPDTTWYNTTATTFTLTTAEQFMGIAKLVNAGTTTFSGKTIKLGADIIINTGDASTWTASTTGLYTWIPIGHDRNRTYSFQGTFDGQGHYISGVFSPSTWTSANGSGTYTVGRDNGLFYCCMGATLQNFSLVNSAFINTGVASSTATESSASQNVGSVVGRLYNGSTLRNVYSNAKVVGGYGSGGLVGYMGNVNGVGTGVAGCVIENCIYEGTLDFSKAADGGCVGGLVGVDDLSYNSNNAGSVKNCIFAGTLYNRDNVNSCSHISGIMGRTKHTVISKCINAGRLDLGTRQTTGYSNIAYYYEVISGCVEYCYIDADNAMSVNKINLSTAGMYASNMADSSIVGCAQLSTEQFTAANLSALDFTSTWTEIEGDYPVPTAAWNIYNQYRAASIQNVGVQNTDINTDGTYSVRIITQINSLDYEYAGAEITLTAGSSTHGTKDAVTAMAYKSIYTSTGPYGKKEATLGNYFVAVTVRDIPASVGAITLKFKPYAVKNGSKNYSEEWSVDYDSGQYVSSSINVLIYNIYNESNEPGDENLETRPYRQQMILDTVNEVHPDVFMTQETTQWWLDYLNSNLPDEYAWAETASNGYSTDISYMAIFYDTEKLELVENGMFWPSETPDVFSTFSDPWSYRIVTWAKFKQKSSGKEFMCVNLHLDGALTCNTPQAEVVLAFLKQYESTPIIFGGDFNRKKTDTDTTPYEVFSAYSRVEDAQSAAQISSPSGAPIDFTFVTPSEIEVIEYKVLVGKVNESGIAASDHDPQLTTFYLK